VTRPAPRSFAWRLGAQRLLDAALGVLLAPACAACAAPLDAPTQGAVCSACWDAVRRSLRPTLTRSASLLTTVGAAADYDGAIPGLIKALKYEGRTSLAAPLGSLMRERGPEVLDGAACVVPVPLHPWRRLTRGFNQAAILAAPLPLPVIHALWRPRATAPQAGLPAADRRRNVRGAFALAPWLRTPALAGLRGRIVVLVDDVYTTGSTLEACALVLREAGVREVRALTVARAAAPAAARPPSAD